MTEAIIGGAVLASIAALAVNDARRAMVDPHMVLALLGAAAAWRFAGPGDGGAWARLADGVLGAALGIACVMAPIGAAQLWGRRWPLYPGDAMLLGAFGFLLGVPGLAWTMLLGSGFALLYRFWLQRRRGRPFRKGLVPLGPGMCAGAAVVFLCTTFGVAWRRTGQRNRFPRSSWARPCRRFPPRWLHERYRSRANRRSPSRRWRGGSRRSPASRRGSRSGLPASRAALRCWRIRRRCASPGRDRSPGCWTGWAP